MRKASVVVSALTIACFLFFQAACTTQAQETKPQVSPEQMKEYMNVMMKSMIELYSSPEMAKMQAKFYRSLYEELIQTGFTKEEALQIVISQGSILRGGNK